MQAAIGHLVHAGLPATRGMAYPEREAREERSLVIVEAKLKDHAP
jgi:hypothetical protein